MYKIGIDEAGRGPWFWPVVACSFSFVPGGNISQELKEKINDSKKLTDKKRKEIFHELIALSQGDTPSVVFWVGVVDNQMIDTINIKQANREAMRRSLVEILRKIPKDQISGVLIDGNDNYTFEELTRKPLFIVEGDAKVCEIGAASIIAKVFRDQLLETYAILYPDLELEKHKGYGTKKHQEYLSEPAKITSFHRVSYKPVQKILQQKPKLLLHVCCGPDATIPIVDLKKDYEVIAFWYDPNIQPKKEYDKRLQAFIKVCEIEWVPYIEGEYDVENFLHQIRGLESTPEKGAKCEVCYDMRLKRSAYEAQKLWIRFWTSTLNTSPHKDLEKMFRLWEKHSLEKKLEFLKIAFRKNNGFLRSVEYCQEHDIYRQNYCGCIYSDTFPGKKKSNGGWLSG